MPNSRRSLLAFAAIFSIPAAATAQGPAPMARFNSVALRGGGVVVLRHGPAQSVTFVAGRARHTRIGVERGRLVVDNCVPQCPRGYALRLEVVAPDIAGLAVADGGTIQTVGAFPRQVALAASVDQGGTIDIRAMRPASLAASVNSGGRILARPGASLTARIDQGGMVTYWGNPAVRRAIQGGGIVSRGSAADAGKPLREFGPDVPPIPPLPPLPPLPPFHNPER